MTTKVKTPTPKAKQYIRAVIEGRVSHSGAYLALEGDTILPTSLLKSFEVIDSPSETVNLPTKVGSVVLVDPANKHNMLSACIRVKPDEYGNCWSSYGDTYTADDFAEDCIRYGYKVVE